MRDLSQLSDSQLDSLIAAHSAQDQAAPQPQNATNPDDQYSFGDSLLRGAANIGSFGLAPKVAAGIGTAYAKLMRPDLFQDQSLGDTYGQAYDVAKQQQAESQAQHPIASILGGIAGIPAAMAGLAAGGAEVAPSTFLGNVGLNSLYGGLYGLGSSDYNSAGQTAKDVATSAGTNAVLGAALQGVGSVAGKSVNSIYNFLANKISPANLTSEQQAAVDLASKFNKPKEEAQASTNSNSSQKTTSPSSEQPSGNTAPFTLADLINGQNAATNPVIQNLAKNYPDVHLTLAQASRRGDVQAVEDAMAAGVYGNDNANAIKNIRTNNNSAFQGIGQNLRNDIGGSEFIEPNVAINPLTNRIQNESQEAYNAKQAAYKDALGNNTVLNVNNLSNFSQNASEKLAAAGFAPSNTPGAYNQLKAFDDIFSSEMPENTLGVNINRLEAYRQGLNSFSSTNGQDKAAVGLIKNEFDNHLNNTIDQSLLSGDSDVLDKIKNARALNTIYKQNFSANGDSGPGQKIIADIANNAGSSEPYTDQQVVNKILGSSELGFTPQAAQVVNKLGDFLGRDSPEFQGIKMETVNRVLKPLLGQASKGDFNVGNLAVQTYKNNLAKNMPVLKNILEPDEIQNLKDYGDLGSVLYQIERSGFNPPQTTIMQKLLEGGKAIPLLNHVVQAGEYLKNSGASSKYIKYNESDLKSAIQSLNSIKQTQESGGGIVPQALDYVNNTIGKSSISNALTGSALSGINSSKELESKAPPQSLGVAPQRGNLANYSESQIDALIAQQRAAQTQQAPAVNPNDAADAEGIAKAIKTRQQNTGQLMMPSSSTQTSTPLLNKIAQIESGGNPNARSSTSSASGLYQFTNATWRQAVDKYGAQTGINYADKNNPRAQAAMTQLMLQDNGAELKNYLGRAPSDTELYLTHFLGLGGAKSLLSANPNQYAAYVLPMAAKANRAVFFQNGRPLTVAEVYANFDKKIRSV